MGDVMPEVFDPSRAEPWPKPDPELRNVKWKNEKGFLSCTEHGNCGYMTLDKDGLEQHVINVHMLRSYDMSHTAPHVKITRQQSTGTILKERVTEDGQVTVDRNEVFTEDDRRRAVLDSLQVEQFTCPFCFTVYPNSTVTRFFTTGGKLSTKALCSRAAGGCNKTMMLESMRVVRRGPREHGRFLGTFGSSLWFEKVEHDKFMPALKKLYPRVSSLQWDSPEQPMNKFWEGYGETNTDWKQKHDEKMRIKKAMDDARAAGQISDDDTPDEGGY